MVCPILFFVVLLLLFLQCFKNIELSLAHSPDGKQAGGQIWRVVCQPPFQEVSECIASMKMNYYFENVLEFSHTRECVCQWMSVHVHACASVDVCTRGVGVCE